MSHKILIVEDEAIVAMDLEDRISALGFDTVGPVARGDDAVRLVHDQSPDLVLMDIQIQGDMDGVQTADMIHKECDIPVIFLTANSDEATLERAKATGPLAYLLKPVEDRDLRNAIDVALQRHELERKLRESEQWVKTLLASIGDAVVATDGKGIITFVNPVALNILGLASTKDVVGRHVDDALVFVDKVHQPLENPIFEVLRTGEIVFLRSDASLRLAPDRFMPVEDSAAPIRDAHGTIHGVVLVFRDVTLKRQHETIARAYSEQLERDVAERTQELVEANEKLQTENRRRTAIVRALEQSEKRFRESFEYAPTGIALVDTLGALVVFNQSLSDFLGLEGKDIQGKELRHFMAADQAIASSPTTILNITETTLVSFSTPGGKRWGEVSISSVHENEGTLSHYVLQVVDVTQRKDAELERARLARIVENNPSVVLLLDQAGCVQYANKAAGERFAHTNSERLRISEIWRTEEDPRLWSNVVRAVALDGAWYGECSFFHQLTRTDQPYDAVVFDLQDSESSEPLFCMYAQDISERKLLEAEELRLTGQLRQAEKMESLGKLAGGVAHDLNNILGPIVGYPDLILMKMPGDDPLRPRIEKIRNAAQAASQMIQDLLTMARRGRATSEPVCWKTIARTFLESATVDRIREEKPAVAVRAEVHEVAPVDGVPSQFTQVLMNLVVNAADAIEDGQGDVLVSVRQMSVTDRVGVSGPVPDGEYVVVSVADTGCGIPAEHISRIFEPYYSSKEMKKSAGSGLGLSVLYGVVKDFNGHIEVLSEAGKGTTFSLYFPARPAAVRNEVTYEAAPGYGHTPLP